MVLVSGDEIFWVGVFLVECDSVTMQLDVSSGSQLGVQYTR